MNKKIGLCFEIYKHIHVSAFIQMLKGLADLQVRILVSHELLWHFEVVHNAIIIDIMLFHNRRILE
jgi:hypothetical protein